MAGWAAATGDADLSAPPPQVEALLGSTNAVWALRHLQSCGVNSVAESGGAALAALMALGRRRPAAQAEEPEGGTEGGKGRVTEESPLAAALCTQRSASLVFRRQPPLLPWSHCHHSLSPCFHRLSPLVPHFPRPRAVLASFFRFGLSPSRLILVRRRGARAPGHPCGCFPSSPSPLVVVLVFSLAVSLTVSAFSRKRAPCAPWQRTRAHTNVPHRHVCATHECAPGHR